MDRYNIRQNVECSAIFSKNISDNLRVFRVSASMLLIILHIMFWLSDNIFLPYILVQCLFTRGVRKDQLFHHLHSISAELLKNKPHAEVVDLMILLAIEYAVQRSFLVYGDYYITFMRGHETASYVDTVRIWKTVLQRKNAIE